MGGDDKTIKTPTTPLWLNPAYAKHIVKGNLMTLSSKPKTVEEGEWIAHQGKLPSDSASAGASARPTDLI